MEFKQYQTRLTSIYKSESLEIGSEIFFFFLHMQFAALFRETVVSGRKCKYWFLWCSTYYSGSFKQIHYTF